MNGRFKTLLSRDWQCFIVSKIGMGDEFVHWTWALPMDIQSRGHHSWRIASPASPASHFHLQLALGSEHQQCSFHLLFVCKCGSKFLQEQTPAHDTLCGKLGQLVGEVLWSMWTAIFAPSNIKWKVQSISATLTSSLSMVVQFFCAAEGFWEWHATGCPFCLTMVPNWWLIASSLMLNPRLWSKQTKMASVAIKAFISLKSFCCLGPHQNSLTLSRDVRGARMWEQRGHMSLQCSAIPRKEQSSLMVWLLLA